MPHPTRIQWLTGDDDEVIRPGPAVLTHCPTSQRFWRGVWSWLSSNDVTGEMLHPRGGLYLVHNGRKAGTGRPGDEGWGTVWLRMPMES